jgi:homoserine acetyltransferase
LQVNHLRLLVGASMGCMEGWMWGESNPGDMDAMLLLSCLPVEVASRNRMVRKIMVDDIRLDPGWNHGNYTEQPYGLRAALGHLLVVGSAPTIWQMEYPTSALADKYVDQYIEDNLKTTTRTISCISMTRRETSTPRRNSAKSLQACCSSIRRRIFGTRRSLESRSTKSRK